MLDACRNCERRKDNDAPPGSAEAIARARGARLLGCLNICNDFSIKEGVNGVNYRDTIGEDVQKGTMLVDEKGEPTNVFEIYTPTRVHIDLSGVDPRSYTEVEIITETDF